MPLITYPESLWKRIRRIQNDLLETGDPASPFHRRKNGIIFANLGRPSNMIDEFCADDALVPESFAYIELPSRTQDSHPNTSSRSAWTSVESSW